jgi:membrane associated rhomboid family serine protease
VAVDAHLIGAIGGVLLGAPLIIQFISRNKE